MSGIVGLWNRAGRPVEPDVFGRMSATLAHRGPDGEGHMLRLDVGFSWRHQWTSPEDVGGKDPLVGPSGTALVMDGRLDNRGDLLSSLDLSRTSSDAACALAAYERWGEGFAARLNGDFAIAVFDLARRRIVLARDAIGIRPLYYHQGAHFFAFASEIKALLAHPDVPCRPDDDGLADFLMIGARPLDRQDVTCFMGISALPAAHVAIVTERGVSVRRYWDFDTAQSLKLGSFGEYAEGFRAHFAEAVRRRTWAAHPVAISVSGGLDSSSVFCQAESLRPGALGISYVGAQGTDADERGYLLDLERQYGTHITRFPIEPLLGVVKGAEDQVRAIEAPFLDYMWGVTCAVHQEARAKGARVLLSGHWGDQVLFSSAYLVDLLRAFRWGEILRHTREYRRWLSGGEVKELKRRFALQAVRRHVPVRLVPFLKMLRRRLSPPARVGPWFGDEFLEHALMDANRPAALGSGFHSSQAAALYIEARSKYHVHCMEWNNKIGALHGLDAAFPFLDRDLLQFLMSVPGDVQNQGGVPRALLREALRGVLPEPVRMRSWKADFTAPVNAGVLQDLTRIARTLSAESLGVRMGYLDPGRLAGEVARLSGGLGRAQAVEAWELTDLFGLETWLSVFLGKAHSTERSHEEGEERKEEAVPQAAARGPR
jgi:asparagine synthase (glutamine-hydrolysing)